MPMKLSFVFFFHCILFRLALSLSPTYQACQLKKSSEESPLTGCPEGTLYVSSTESSANFSSIQEAIDSLPSTGHALILIGEGEYPETLSVTRYASLTLLGQLDPATASISGGNASQRNIVNIWNHLYVENDVTDGQTATLTVYPSEVSTVGNVDFKFYNINFENRAADYAISPALVTCITYANVSFYGCAFASWQDTWYTGWDANTYVVDSIIYGQTDYVFGCGIAWFQSVTFANRGCGGGITAWQGSPDTRNGAYISNSRIIRSPDANETTVTTGLCYLGRPWNEYAISVFLQTYMDDCINPAGFRSWSAGSTPPSTSYYAEYGSHGPGSNTSPGVRQSQILNATQASQFTLKEVFGEAPRWIDTTYKY